MPAPFIRLGSCSNLVKCSWNLRWISARSLAYTTCSNVSDWSSDTNLTRQLLEILGEVKVNKSYKTLDELKREPSTALLFITQLKESGFKHDVETYMTIVRLLCDSGMDARLNNLFMYHVIENINREHVGFEISDLLEALINEKLIKAVDVLVKVYASVGRFEEGIHTLSEMKSRSGLMVSTRTCNFLMNKLIEWDKGELVESVYEKLKSNGLIPNVYTYGILIKEHCRMGRLKEAWNVFELMKEAGVEPNAFMYGTYIHALCSNGNTELAFRVLKNLRESNKPVDVLAYTCVIRGYVEESKLQDAEDVFLDMKFREVVPDAECYGALIRGYCLKRDSVKAYGLVVEMESRGIKIDDEIVRWMMECLCGKGMLDEALKLFKYFMKSSRVFIDGVTFNIAIDAACKLGRMDDAMGLVEGMKVRKMMPWKMHYRTLMHGYCLHGEPWSALYMFEEMIRNGLRPHSNTFDVLAREFLKCRYYGPLYILLMRHKDWNHKYQQVLLMHEGFFNH